MSNKDRALVALLAVALGGLVLAGVFQVPRSATTTSTLPTASAAATLPTPTPDEPSVYREGVLSRPSSITPLTARTQADRDLVALIFRGLARLGPDGTLLPDLAQSWQVDKAGKNYTFTLRPDARWQDGAPVTATDVAFTIAALRDPAYKGPLAGSWTEVTATVIDQQTVRLTLATPLGGFLTAATLPLLPAHLLGTTPIADLASSPFSLQPVGSGPYRLVTVDADHAVLQAVPGVTDGTFRPAPSPSPSPQVSAAPSAAGSGSGPSPTPTPTVSAEPTTSPPPGSPFDQIELRFFDDPNQLADALKAGEVDAAGGLPATTAVELAGTTGLQLTRYPRSVFTGVVLNLRPSVKQFADQKVRIALLKALDRNKLIELALDGTGALADTPIPPASWAFDAKSSHRVAYDPKAAISDLKAAGWRKTSSGWVPKGSKKVLTVEIVTPDQASNPVAWLAAQAVAGDWRAIGLTVTVVPLTPTQFVNDRLMTGSFSAAIVDVNLGLDPDLYPLLASTQAGTAGSNLSGVQSSVLDKLLVNARSPGSDAKRKAAYAALQDFLSRAEVMLPLFFRDYLFVSSTRLVGPAVRQLADPSDRYWDVLDWRLAGAG